MNIVVTSYHELDALIAKSLAFDFTDSHTFQKYKYNKGIPYYSSNFQDTEVILKCCDKLCLSVQITRNTKTINCVIANNIVGSFKMGCFVSCDKYKSMSLAVCLAWLQYQDVEVQLNLNL